jgi:hypothetical protein
VIRNIREKSYYQYVASKVVGQERLDPTFNCSGTLQRTREEILGKVKTAKEGMLKSLQDLREYWHCYFCSEYQEWDEIFGKRGLELASALEAGRARTVEDPEQQTALEMCQVLDYYIGSPRIQAPVGLSIKKAGRLGRNLLRKRRKCKR